MALKYLAEMTEEHPALLTEMTTEQWNPLQSSQWNLTKDSRKSPDHDNPNKLVTPRSVPLRRPSVPTFGQHSTFAQSTLASGRGDTSLSCNLNTLYILTEHRLTTLHKRATPCHALGARQVQALMAPPFFSLEER
jgi:hypothetical protein